MSVLWSRGHRWTVRSTGDGAEHATYREGPYVVYVCDQDGDRTIWDITMPDQKDAVSGRPLVVASGEIPEVCVAKRCAWDIGMDVALAALKAIKAERGEDDH